MSAPNRSRKMLTSLQSAVAFVAELHEKLGDAAMERIGATHLYSLMDDTVELDWRNGEVSVIVNVDAAGTWGAYARWGDGPDQRNDVGGREECIALFAAAIEHAPEPSRREADRG